MSGGSLTYLLQEAQAGAVQQQTNQTVRAVELAENATGLVAAEDGFGGQR